MGAGGALSKPVFALVLYKKNGKYQSDLSSKRGVKQFGSIHNLYHNVLTTLEIIGHCPGESRDH